MRLPVRTNYTRTRAVMPVVPYMPFLGTVKDWHPMKPLDENRVALAAANYLKMGQLRSRAEAACLRKS
jgi:hypothetical protein